MVQSPKRYRSQHRRYGALIALGLFHKVSDSIPSIQQKPEDRRAVRFMTIARATGRWRTGQDFVDLIAARIGVSKGLLDSIRRGRAQ